MYDVVYPVAFLRGSRDFFRGKKFQVFTEIIFREKKVETLHLIFYVCLFTPSLVI